LIRANCRTGQTKIKKNCNFDKKSWGPIKKKPRATPRSPATSRPPDSDIPPLDFKKHCFASAFLATSPAVSQTDASANRRRLTIWYSGSVQGVGFRYTAKTVATGFEITGIIRNLPDGRVELVCEGARKELEEFRAALRDAGLAGFIRDEQVNWADAKNEFRGFEIVR
jgi:acylphosphatase